MNDRLQLLNCHTQIINLLEKSLLSMLEVILCTLNDIHSSQELHKIKYRKIISGEVGSVYN